MIRISSVTLACVLALTAPAAMAAEVLIHDAKSSPESLTAAPNGDVLVGSASSPFIYKIKAGGNTAEVFVDVSSEAPTSSFLGQLADGASNTLWACQLTPVPDTKPAQRHSTLRGFDLSTGKEKLRWNLPGDNSTCNDMAVGPDKALYVTDTANSKIYRLAAGATTADLYLENRVLAGIDGITFLNGVLYVNNVWFNKLYRIPVDATGKPGTPVDIWMDAPVKGPDGMRAANGVLYLAENATGKIDALTIDGDIAHVKALKDGLTTPTAVEPSGNILWIAERGAGKVWSVPAK
ncbi:MAG TPA: hypothetical protein VG839_06350 [Asticcacaulis sp.]|nr:hypothetical protein [Asticcacaulis sp.]